MRLDAAVAAIRASALGDRANRIIPHLKPSFRMHATRRPDAGNALVSRFAGLGVLPRGTPWPEWDSSALHRRWIAYLGEHPRQARVSAKVRDEELARYEALVRDNPRPIPFLAMIRLRDLGPDASRVGLQERGTMLFFYDVERMQGSFWPEARGGWRILFVEDDADLEVVARPPIQVEGFVSSTLTLELEYELPEDLRAETGDDDLRLYGGHAAFGVLQHTLLGAPPDREPLVHRLGGPPQEVQHDLFRRCQLASNGIDAAERVDSPRERALAAEARRWRLLLQLDSDEAGPGWMWGDAGRLYYCLHEDDLRDGRFDRAWCVEQSY